MVEGPCTVKIGIPWPEPVPEVNVLRGPSHPAEVVGDGVLCVGVSDNIPDVIPESWTIVVTRPNGFIMSIVTLSLQEVVYVSSPLVVFTLSLGLMPIVPVLCTSEVSIDIAVAIAVFHFVTIIVTILTIIRVVIPTVIVVVVIAVIPVVVI